PGSQVTLMVIFVPSTVGSVKLTRVVAPPDPTLTMRAKPSAPALIPHVNSGMIVSFVAKSRVDGAHETLESAPYRRSRLVQVRPCDESGTKRGRILRLLRE